jgi:hypothetical protein
MRRRIHPEIGRIHTRIRLIQSEISQIHTRKTPILPEIGRPKVVN